jgi:hypothetical protein
VGETTFLEAYERTGRILNVTVCPADTNEPPRLLNFLTAPNALVWSAVAASAAFPGLFPAQNLLAKNAAGETVRCAGAATAVRRAVLLAGATGAGWAWRRPWAQLLTAATHCSSRCPAQVQRAGRL